MFQFDNTSTILAKENRNTGVLSHSITYFWKDRAHWSTDI